MRRQKAITLVEVLVATTISFLLLTVLHRIFVSSVRQFTKTQEHLQAMQVAQLALEYIDNDLHGMILKDITNPRILSASQATNTVSFFVSEGGKNRGYVYHGEKVSYGLAPVAGETYFHLKRKGKAMSHLPLKSLQFEAIEIVSCSGEPHFYLKTTVTGVDSLGKGEFTLVGLTALDIVTHSLLGKQWSPNVDNYKGGF